MDENFRRLGAEQNENDCRKRLVCRLNEKNNDSKDVNKNELVKLTLELRYFPSIAKNKAFKQSCVITITVIYTKTTSWIGLRHDWTSSRSMKVQKLITKLSSTEENSKNVRPSTLIAIDTEVRDANKLQSYPGAEKWQTNHISCSAARSDDENKTFGSYGHHRKIRAYLLTLAFSLRVGWCCYVSIPSWIFL